ncbi:DarT ssDNA thymidine ADP-ribosyltransferase family protein [uncultured Brevundimonas sp.]|uniref:DarT ssDNA thymidine ADP-ribosyltransferase family protein n=1 Tax=uncultured Brevundimonas sp. TaxID=213418 RepID=UPI003453D531
MALTPQFTAGHVAEWEERLSAGYYNYRAQWPSRLFHHAPLENIAQILRSGFLLSRNDSNNIRAVDVADATVLANRTRAHAFCRFYFRPRTPTQFHIEGIRKTAEYYNGVTHSPTLGMLIFDAASLLQSPNVRFSDGNMQSNGTLDGDGEAFFQTINFSKVYHEGAIGGDSSIITARCAEVLAPSPLEIADKLRAIICRSHAERAFLIDLMGGEGDQWHPRIRVSDDLRVFEKKYTFIERVSLDQGGLLFSMSPRPDGADVVVRVQVEAADGTIPVAFGPGPLKPFPPYAQQLWRIQGRLEPGYYRAKVWLENCLAFSGTLVQDDLPF